MARLRRGINGRLDRRGINRRLNKDTLRQAEELASDHALQEQLVQLARQATAIARTLRRERGRRFGRRPDRGELRQEAFEFVHRLDRTLRLAESKRGHHLRRNALLALVLGGGVTAVAVAVKGQASTA